MPDPTAFFRAIGEFNAGRYFEAHDLLEAIWVETSGDEKRFLQGLIQVSVGFYHAGNGNPSGALSQWGKGTAKLAAFLPGHAGIDIEALLADVRAWSRAAEQALARGTATAEEGEPPPAPPKIELNHNSLRSEPWPR